MLSGDSNVVAALADAADAADGTTTGQQLQRQPQPQNRSAVPSAPRYTLPSPQAVTDATTIGIGASGGSPSPSSTHAQAQNQWTVHHDHVIRKWKSQAFVYMQLQQRAHYFYRWIYNFLSYPVIVLTTLSSATIFTTQSDYVKYWVASMSAVAAVLTSLVRQMRPAELAQQHASTAHQYHAFLHTIESCLNMRPDMRPDAASFMEKARIELDNLISAQLDPPSVIVQRFEQTYGEVEGILYGDDIVGVVLNNLRTRAYIRQLMKQQHHAKRAGGGAAAPPGILPGVSARFASWWNNGSSQGDTSFAGPRQRDVVPCPDRDRSARGGPEHRAL